MKFYQKLFILFIAFSCTLILGNVQAKAAQVNCYTIEDENGVIVDTGIINPNARITWRNISLERNYTLSIFPESTIGYYVKKGTTINMSYNLSSSATTSLMVKQNDSNTVYTKNYSTSSCSGSYTTTETDYYKIQIKNSSSNDILFESITIVY